MSEQGLSLNQDARKRLDERIGKICKKHKVQGASVGLMGKDGPLYINTYGVVDDTGTKNTPSHKMMIGSNTKILTALAVLTLKDGGKLSLDADIHEYLPDFSIKRRFEARPITVRHLLMHVSGIPSDDWDLITNPALSLKACLEVLKDEYLTALPETMFAYSNIGYGLLGLIIEHVSGMPYTDYLAKHVLRPLGLSVEIIDDDADLAASEGPLSWGFDKKKKACKDLLSNLISAGSSTYASLEDMLALLKFFLNHEKQSLLEEDTMQEMLTPPKAAWTLPEGMKVGLGLMHRKAPYYHQDAGPFIGHGGATIYHHSLFDFSLEHGFGITVLTNSERGAQAAYRISNALAIEAFRAIGIELPETPPKIGDAEEAVDHSIGKDYVTPSMKLPGTVKKGEPRLKYGPLPFALKLQRDGYYQAAPRGLSRLPFFKDTIKRLRFKSATIAGEEVLFLEQRLDYRHDVVPFAAPFEASECPDAWEAALGDYEVVNENPVLRKLCEKARVKRKDGDLVLSLKLLNRKYKHHLKVLNDSEAVVQGHGRDALGTVFLEKRDGDIHLRHKGLLLKKRR